MQNLAQTSGLLHLLSLFKREKITVTCNRSGGGASHSPMVQMMPVFRAVMGGESMSRRHMCSRNVSAMAACSCWVWMKAVPTSLWGFDMVAEALGPGELKRV